MVEAVKIHVLWSLAGFGILYLALFYNKMKICDYPLIKVFEEMLSLGENRTSKIIYGFLRNMWDICYKVGLNRGKVEQGREEHSLGTFVQMNDLGMVNRMR